MINLIRIEYWALLVCLVGGILEVLLALPLGVHGVQDGLPLGLVPPVQLVYLPLHLRVQVGHPLLELFVCEELQLQRVNCFNGCFHVLYYFTYLSYTDTKVDRKVVTNPTFSLGNIILTNSKSVLSTKFLWNLGWLLSWWQLMGWGGGGSGGVISPASNL